MSEAIQLHSRVGDDGILNLRVDLGREDAQRDVVVTIQRLSKDEFVVKELPWQEFLDRTYGSCAGLGLERPEQGDYEQREAIQ